MSDNLFIIIPSLNPDEKLQKTVNGLKEVGFKHFILVDDGSDKNHRQFFPKEDEYTTILCHHSNHGKGAALKTAFRHIKYNHPQATGMITVDGDGQHLPEDVKNCAALMEETDCVVLGCRDFSKEDVPLKSSLGNRITRTIFRVLCGIKITDTQTGLRAFPAHLIPFLLDIKGNRFEYETNMLLKFRQHNIGFIEQTIETVYLNDNETSHFKPFRDSIRIYKFFLSYFASSVISFVVDIVLFYVLCRLLGGILGIWAATLCTVAARAVSSFVNYSINRKTVFDSKADAKKTFFKYYALAIPQMVVSALLVTALSSLFGAAAGGKTIIKAIVDTFLFFLSYRIQQSWVFAKGKRKKDVIQTDKAETDMPQEPEQKQKLGIKKIICRSLLSLGSVILALVITVISVCVVITHGPSESLRDMLVLSAKQASATKWIPELFLSKETVNGILAKSEEINTDTIDISDLTQIEDEWTDSQNGVKLIFESKSKFKAYVLLVKDPARVKVGVSSENFKSAYAGARIFDIADKYDCLAAINAGEFADAGGQGTGATPMGLTYSFGKCVWNDGLHRTFMGFDSNNKLICKASMTKAQAEELGIRDAVSFQTGNVLIEQTGESVKLYYSDRNTGTAQRTAIGQRADGTVIMIVTDGRSADSIGATRNDIIDMLVEYGAVNAGMLDGGSSAMMYYKKYYNIYPVDKESLDSYQKQGLVNRYKAFTNPRRIPTYFIVTE